jgi:hypothetical protein
MRAASKSESGIDNAYWRMRKIPTMVAAEGRITPQYVLIKPSSFMSKNSGIIAT